MILHHLNNPFANPKISEDNFGKIALTHLERLKTNNQEGQFTTLIEATQPLYDAYKEAVSDEAFEIALREGKTITVDAAIKGLKHFASRKEGVIADAFDGKPEIYEQFFPHGLTEYSKATKKNIDTLFYRLVKAMQAHTAELGDEMAEDALTLYNNYVALRDTQLQAIGEVKELDSDADAARIDLAERIFLNLLALITMFVENTDRVKDFFDLSITKRNQKDDDDETPGDPSEPTPE